MDRFAIFVDAGYFFAAGAHAITSQKISRNNIALVTPSTLAGDLKGFGTTQTGIQSMLRIYWYDAMPGPRLSMEQSAIAHLPGVKLRLGSLNGAGEQKGVDSLSDAVKVTLGPKGRNVVLGKGFGSPEITNDGVTILEEMQIEHPTAKMIVEVAKTQENEVGDGTTTVVVLAGELLSNAEDLLDKVLAKHDKEYVKEEEIGIAK